MAAVSVYAVTNEPTETESPTTTVKKNQLDDLKSRIASKVAQLKLTEKKGTIGTVTDISDTQITINEISGNQRFIDLDELTKFDSPSDKNFGVSDLKKGTTIGVLGIYNKQSRRILAREINLITVPKFINGAVILINKKEFSLIVIDKDQKQTTVDIENITKTYSYDKSSGLIKSGFSKITDNTNIVVVGYQNKEDEKRITASTIILLPQIPINPKINIVPDALEQGATVVPSTGSGKKLTPITKD